MLRTISAELLLSLAALTLHGCALAPKDLATGALVVQEQGSFAVGGTVIENAGAFNLLKPSSEGQGHHGDHAYANAGLSAN